MKSYWTKTKGTGLTQEQKMQYAKEQIQSLGYLVFEVDRKTLEFQFNDHNILFYPAKGWATGKTITDCRGLKNLLKQIKP